MGEVKRMSYAQVVFNLPINHAYTYRIPSEMDHLKPGMRVLVPFGKRMITGITIELIEKSTLTSLKYIIDILDEQPLISPEMMELTRWISEYYLCSWGQALQLVLPKGIDVRDEELIFLQEDPTEVELTERQNELYTLIGDNPGNSKASYRRKFGQAGFYYLLSRLDELGLIIRRDKRKAARVRALIRKYVVIPENYDDLKLKHEDYLKYIKRRPEVDLFLKEKSGTTLLMSDFLRDTGMASGTLHKMAGYGLCAIEDRPLQRQPQWQFEEEDKDIELTAEQVSVVAQIKSRLSKKEFSPFLLHGVTGSGKTQVYIEILQDILAMNRSAVILIPEIALTPQTVGRFREVTKDKMAVFHSKMSAGERLDAWMACYTGKVRVAIGPRSALFAPLKNIGLIVVDEEQEGSYKQSDTNPRYNARDVAVFLARQHDAVIIAGSATPSMESYYNARRGKYHLLEMRNRINNVLMPSVYIVDMKQKRARVAGKISLFSQIMVDKIKERLARREQVIILQNRRGYASFMQCKSCGFIPVCPHCDVTLTYHSYHEKLQCHVCGFQQPAYTDCPNCGGKQIIYKGVGTQRVQSDLQQLLPEARILRMDQDTTKGKNSHDLILTQFAERKADILLGTQMIAKGLDFENVTMVGVISADVGLAIPDFRAPERVFQLLTQVAGRAGRGSKPGEVVVQSYLFSHYAIQMARNHDFIGFYMEEMQHRRTYKYPPFYRLIQVLISAANLSEAISTGRSLAAAVQRRTRLYCQVIGPAPAIIPRVSNMHRWQFYLRLNPKTDPNGRHTKEILRQILEPYFQKRNQKLRVSVDVDPILLN